MSEGYFRFVCPQCGEQRATVNPRNNLAHCFCCQMNWNNIDLLRSEARCTIGMTDPATVTDQATFLNLPKHAAAVWAAEDGWRTGFIRIVQCCQVGLWLRDLLAQMKLKSFPKTSGSKGLQVYVPLNTPVTFDQTKDLSRALAQLLEGQHGNLVTSNMSKALRKNKVFVDWSQNDEHKTTVCVYSLRAKEEPTVSTPVTWDEVENCLRRKKTGLLKFRSDQTVARVNKSGDLFAPVEKLKQKLPKKWKV